MIFSCENFTRGSLIEIPTIQSCHNDFDACGIYKWLLESIHRGHAFSKLLSLRSELSNLSRTVMDSLTTWMCAFSDRKDLGSKKRGSKNLLSFQDGVMHSSMPAIQTRLRHFYQFSTLTSNMSWWLYQHQCAALFLELILKEVDQVKIILKHWSR